MLKRNVEVGEEGSWKHSCGTASSFSDTQERETDAVSPTEMEEQSAETAVEMWQVILQMTENISELL